MKHYIGYIAFLLGTVQGIENTATATEARSVWVDASPKYASVTAKWCYTSA